MNSWKTTLVQRDKLRADRPGMGLAETWLWSVLRAGQAGAHFRRKAPIGPYVVDFLCAGAGLVIDIEPGAAESCARPGLARSAFLHAMGYRRICLQADDVLFDFANVCCMIAQAVSPTGTPLPGTEDRWPRADRAPKRQSARLHDRPSPLPPDRPPRHMAGCP